MPWPTIGRKAGGYHINLFDPIRGIARKRNIKKTIGTFLRKSLPPLSRYVVYSISEGIAMYSALAGAVLAFPRCSAFFLKHGYGVLF